MTEAVRKIKREDGATLHGGDDRESVSEERYGEMPVGNGTKAKRVNLPGRGKRKSCVAGHMEL